MKILGSRAAVLNWAAGSGELRKESDLIPNSSTSAALRPTAQKSQEPSRFPTKALQLHKIHRHASSSARAEEGTCLPSTTISAATSNHSLRKVSRQATFRATKWQSKSHWSSARLRCKPIPHPCLNRSCRGWYQSMLTVGVCAGFFEHCARRSGRREGWRGES